LGPSAGYGGHNYTDIYEAYLGRDRYSPITILEIGIGTKGAKWDARIVHGRNSRGGASVRMWYEYFPNGRILAIDVNPAKYLDNDRIRTFEVNQGDKDELASFLSKIGETRFDYVIDDGSHCPDHQQIALSVLFPSLKPGGYYFIEDLDDNGLGDPLVGRAKSDDVLSTRKVLRSFATTRKFAEPNRLQNVAFLMGDIHSIAFHAPIERFSPSAILNWFVGKRGVFVQYAAGTERLCAIRKTG